MWEYPSMVKGAGLKILCVLLRGFKSHFPHHMKKLRKGRQINVILLIKDFSPSSPFHGVYPVIRTEFYRYGDSGT